MLRTRRFLFTCVLASTACGSSSSSTKSTSAAVDAQPRALTVEVFTSPEAAGAVNSTIVLGETTALVIDAQYTKSGATAVADTIDAAGKTLTHVFITHAHPDHYFGATTLLERFPEAKVVAVPSVVEGMKATAAVKAAGGRQQLGPEFPGEPVIPEPLSGETLRFEGHDLRLLIDMQGDTEPVTGVLLPDNQTAILSDVMFSGVHAWTADSSHQSRQAWMAQLDELMKLDGVTRFIPGHQRPDADQTADALGYTRGYIEKFDQTAVEGVASGPIIEAMSAAYPDVGGAFFLQLGAKVAAGEMEWQ